MYKATKDLDNGCHSNDYRKHQIAEGHQLLKVYQRAKHLGLVQPIVGGKRSKTNKENVSEVISDAREVLWLSSGRVLSSAEETFSQNSPKPDISPKTIVPDIKLQNSETNNKRIENEGREIIQDENLPDNFSAETDERTFMLEFEIERLSGENKALQELNRKLVVDMRNLSQKANKQQLN